LVTTRTVRAEGEEEVTVASDQLSVENGSEDYEVKFSFLVTDNCLAHNCPLGPGAAGGENPPHMFKPFKPLIGLVRRFELLERLERIEQRRPNGRF
jgi:hypothetical protein